MKTMIPLLLVLLLGCSKDQPLPPAVADGCGGVEAPLRMDNSAYFDSTKASITDWSLCGDILQLRTNATGPVSLAVRQFISEVSPYKVSTRLVLDATGTAYAVEWLDVDLTPLRSWGDSLDIAIGDSAHVVW